MIIGSLVFVLVLLFTFVVCVCSILFRAQYMSQRVKTSKLIMIVVLSNISAV